MRSDMRRVRVVKPNKIAAIYKATCELSNNANSVCIYKIHVSTKIYTRCLLKILFDISRGRAMLCYVHIYDDRNLSLNQLLVCGRHVSWFWPQIAHTPHCAAPFLYLQTLDAVAATLQGRPETRLLWRCGGPNWRVSITLQR